MENNLIIGLCNRLIDDRIDTYGVRNTIAYFLDLGITREDMIDLHFDKEDVDYVIKCLADDPEHIFDCE